MRRPGRSLSASTQRSREVGACAASAASDGLARPENTRRGRHPTKEGEPFGIPLGRRQMRELPAQAPCVRVELGVPLGQRREVKVQHPCPGQPSRPSARWGRIGRQVVRGRQDGAFHPTAIRQGEARRRPPPERRGHRLVVWPPGIMDGIVEGDGASDQPVPAGPHQNAPFGELTVPPPQQRDMGRTVIVTSGLRQSPPQGSLRHIADGKPTQQVGEARRRGPHASSRSIVAFAARTCTASWRATIAMRCQAMPGASMRSRSAAAASRRRQRTSPRAVASALRCI